MPGMVGYLKLTPELTGESRRAEHVGEIDLVAMDWDMSQADNMQIGSGLVTSRADIEPITLRKVYDASSPYLALACMQGRAFDEAQICFRKDSGETHLDYLVITLKPVAIASYQVESLDGEDKLTEVVKLAFEHCKVCYTMQDDSHSPGDKHEVEYDIAAGA